MLDLLNSIRNWVLPYSKTEQSRKRRSIFEEPEVSFRPKIRRLGESNMSRFTEDEFASNSRQRFSNERIRSRPSWAKENVTISLEDDDHDIIEVANRPKPTWSELLGRNNPSKFTSTPYVRSNSNGTRDDDVVFVASYLSPQEKKKEKRKSSVFDYKKPLSSQISNGKQSKRDLKGSALFTSIGDVKSKLNRQPIRSSVMDQSFRLEEKLKFRDLIARAAPSFCQTTRKNLDPFSKYGGIVGSIFQPGRGRKMVEMATGRKKSVDDYVDLTRPDFKTKETRLTTKDEIQRVLDDFELKDSDSDVEILPTPPSPKPDIHVEPVNSLKVIMDTSKNTQKDWLTDVVQKHREGIAQKAAQIIVHQNHRKQLEGLSKEVHTKVLSDQFEKCLKLREAVLPIEIEDSSKLPELSDEDQKQIDLALSRNRNVNEVLIEKFNLKITRRDMQTLAGLNWLNDEVINFYMNLIMERSNNSGYPKVYAMNTFFYPKLLKDGHASLRRWTRRVDIFSYDLICVPIHLNVHWCMAIIDFRQEQIKYYDSMGSSNRQCLETLLGYLEAESLDKKKTEYDTSGWELINARDIPQQMNGSDCGMFACTFAEFFARDAKITFSQEHMPYLRRKMVLEILNGELLIS